MKLICIVVIDLYKGEEEVEVRKGLKDEKHSGSSCGQG